jgi:hypothetical protein
MADGDVVSEGVQLINRFRSAQQGVQESKRALNSAECELSNAERALAKWLMPSDMKPGEKIAVWHSDWLFQVELKPREAATDGGTIVTDYEPVVTIRTRGKRDLL